MGFNRRKMEDQRRDAAKKKAAARRATDAQVLEDAERLIAAWNERQAIGAPMIFSPTIGAAIRGILVPVGTLSGLPDHQCHRSAHARPPSRRGGDSFIPSLSCRSCRPNAPFAELVRLSRTSIADECGRSTGGECLATDRDWITDAGSGGGHQSESVSRITCPIPCS